MSDVPPDAPAWVEAPDASGLWVLASWSDVDAVWKHPTRPPRYQFAPGYGGVPLDYGARAALDDAPAPAAGWLGSFIAGASGGIVATGALWAIAHIVSAVR